MAYYEIKLTIEDQVRAHFVVPIGESRGGANLWGDMLEAIYHPEEAPDEGAGSDQRAQGSDQAD